MSASLVGMDTVCCICAELRSTKSCSLADSVPSEKIQEFFIELDITRHLDGKFYICNVCKTSVMSKRKPKRAQKEFLGLLDFPENFKEKLVDICQPNPRILDPKKLIKLNKLEDFMLKLVIPFIRVGHLPRGPYIKVKGDLIMISSDLKESLNKVLPLSQDLIGVSFRRKMSYQGHFIEEYVDKNKIHAYFNFLKDYNHLYQDFSFDDKILENFEKDIMNEINKKVLCIEEQDDAVDEYDDNVNHPGKAKFASNSIIVDKYKEDPNKHTVANKFAEMVVQVETLYESESNNEDIVLDPEDEFFDEDEGLMEENDDEDDFYGESFLEELTSEDFEKYVKFKQLNNKLERLVTIDLEHHCKCNSVKIIASVIDIHSQLLKIQVENQEFHQCLHDCLAISLQFKESGTKQLQGKSDCNHSYNEITNFLQNIVFNKNMSARDIKKLVAEQRKIIDKKLEKVSVAPGLFWSVV